MAGSMRTLTVVEGFLIRLSAPLTPIQHSAGDDRQNGPTGGGYYHLADDGAVVEAPKGWDQGLEDECTDNAANCSGNRVSGA